MAGSPEDALRGLGLGVAGALPPDGPPVVRVDDLGRGGGLGGLLREGRAGGRGQLLVVVGRAHEHDGAAGRLRKWRRRHTGRRQSSELGGTRRQRLPLLQRGPAHQRVRGARLCGGRGTRAPRVHRRAARGRHAHLLRRDVAGEQGCGGGKEAVLEGESSGRHVDGQGRLARILASQGGHLAAVGAGQIEAEPVDEERAEAFHGVVWVGDEARVHQRLDPVGKVAHIQLGQPLVEGLALLVLEPLDGQPRVLVGRVIVITIEQDRLGQRRSNGV